MPEHGEELTRQMRYHFTFLSHTRKAPSFYMLFIENKRILLDFFLGGGGAGGKEVYW